MPLHNNLLASLESPDLTLASLVRLHTFNVTLEQGCKCWLSTGCNAGCNAENQDQIKRSPVSTSAAKFATLGFVPIAAFDAALPNPWPGLSKPYPSCWQAQFDPVLLPLRTAVPTQLPHRLLLHLPLHALDLQKRGHGFNTRIEKQTCPV